VGKIDPHSLEGPTPYGSLEPSLCSTNLSTVESFIARMADKQDSLYTTSSHLETMPHPEQGGLPEDPKSADAADPNNPQLKR
jgi:hypothetical protein